MSLGLLLKQNLMAGNPARTKGVGNYEGIPIPPCGGFARNTTKTVPPLGHLSLHDEIEHFVAFMEPTSTELALRADLILRFKNVITRLEPKAKVQPVGSYVTGLFLPTSDIDMVITFNDHPTSSLSSTRLSLAFLADKIRLSGFSSKIENILNASIPLLKITDAKTGIEIDLTGLDDHGVRATAAVLSGMKENHQVISSLIKVVKFFLSIRRLGSTYTGGINSYLLVWMVVAWVHLEMPKLQISLTARAKANVSSDVDSLVSAMSSFKLSATGSSCSGTVAQNRTKPINLGAALLAFLKFYGTEFDYTARTIKFSSPKMVSIGLKVYSYSRYGPTQRYLFSITDPADIMVDLGSKAYAIKHVQASFRGSHAQLLSLEQGTGSRSEVSRATVEGTLGSVLGGDYADFIEKRNRIASTWENN